MDIGDTIAPTSDQLDACDLLAGPMTFTIERISPGTSEQPFNLHLKEFDRPWRPGKSMRRVLVACWGPKAAEYVGRRVTLFCDPTVRFGGVDVGGTRVSHLSHIDKPKSIPLLVTRGKSAMFKVLPLVEEAPKTAVVPLAQRITEAIAAFAHGGVTQEQLQRRVGTIADNWTAQDVADLDALFQSLKRREITKEAAFPMIESDPPADNSPPAQSEGQQSEAGEYDPTTEPGWQQ